MASKTEKTGKSGKTEKEPKWIVSPINNPMINYKVYYMSAAEKLAYSLLLFAAGGGAGWVFYGNLFKVDGDATTMTYISNALVICLFGGIAL